MTLVAAPATADEAREDEIVLRDGRHVRGRIVQLSADRWVSIETDDGRQHTYAWDAIAELDKGSAPRDARAAASSRTAWEKRSGPSFSHELRVTASTLLFPDKTLGLSGYCSNTVSTSPASIYGNTASAHGIGFGGGVGGRIGIMHRTQPNPDHAVSWWAFRAGAGADLGLFHARLPVDIKPFSGELCTLVARLSHDVRYETSAFLVAQVPLHLGGAAAFGRLDGARWRGVVVGAAWAPAFVFAGIFRDDFTASLNPLGLELTLDFALLVADGSLRRSDGHLRVALTGMAPATSQQLGTLTLGVGLVHY